MRKRKTNLVGPFGSKAQIRGPFAPRAKPIGFIRIKKRKGRLHA